MGKDSPSAELNDSQASQLDKIEDDVDNDKLKFQNNYSSKKESNCQSITDTYKDNPPFSHTRSYHQWKSQSFVKECLNNEQHGNDEVKRRICGEDCQQDLHGLAHHFLDKRSLNDDSDPESEPYLDDDSDLESEPYSDDDSDLESEPGELGFTHSYNSNNIDNYTVEHIGKTDNEIDLRIFQKKDYSQDVTKEMPPFLEKCSWYKKSEEEILNETTIFNEDNDDSTVEELSTSDNSSEDLEDVVNETNSPDYNEISFMQASEGSSNEDNEDSSTDDDSDSETDESSTNVVYPVDSEEVQEVAFVVEDLAINEAMENDWIDPQQVLEIGQPVAPIPNDDADIVILEENICSDEANNGLTEADQTVYALQKSKLAVAPFYFPPNITTPIDKNVKHHLSSNHGYHMETVGDHVVIVNNVETPPLQDNINLLLPGQPRPLEGLHEQPPLAGLSGSQRIHSADGDDATVFNSPFSTILESPQAMEESSIYPFHVFVEVGIQ